MSIFAAKVSASKSKDVIRDSNWIQIAPHLTTLINGVGWSKGFPRAITSSSLNKLIEKENGKQKLVAVQDITCDKEVRRYQGHSEGDRRIETFLGWARIRGSIHHYRPSLF